MVTGFRYVTSYASKVWNYGYDITGIRPRRLSHIPAGQIEYLYIQYAQWLFFLIV